MSILSLKNVVKTYHKHRAVDGVTFDIPKGSMFGLLGPNGAGKTSLLRIITTITGADEGEVYLDGEKLNQRHPEQIGYLPEERGLYKKMKVGDQLMYLAQLKGLSSKEAKTRLKDWFEKFEIVDWWNKKVQELSKGMQQKVQFIATIVHEPKLLILDEPFSGLDPINTNLIKKEIRKMNQEGTSVIFSTHRMEQVEEMCTDIVLIDKGRNILEGKVADIKEKFKENKFRISFKRDVPLDIDSELASQSGRGDEWILKIKEGHDSNEILRAILKKGYPIHSFYEVLPSLNEIFIKAVNGQSNE